MHGYTTDRALWASNTLMWIAISLGAMPWWLDAISSGSLIDWIVAAALSAALISISLILSGCVLRFAEASEKRHPLTAALVVALGAALGIIEAGMTHAGLAWIDEQKDIGPDWGLWVASFGLSGFNVFSIYTFGRDLKRPHRPETSAGKLLAFRRWNKIA